MSKSQNPLKVADRYLLSPYGLGEAEIEKTFRKLMRHDIDFADLYFQHSRHESWSMEDGIVKEGTHSIEQGVGVRAVSVGCAGRAPGSQWRCCALYPQPGALLSEADLVRGLA